MKRIVILAAIAALAACSKPAPEPAATDTAMADAAAPATEATSLAADGKPATGTYKVTDADGTVTMEEVKADGTYTDTQDGKVIEEGTWVQKSPEHYCWTPKKEGASEICTDEKVENGVWKAYNPVSNKTSTVERVEG